MIGKHITLGILLIQLSCGATQEQPKDLTVVSSIDFNGSVRRHAIGLIESLHDKLSINFIPSRPVTLEDVHPSVKNIVLSDQKAPGKVALLEDPLWYADAMPNSKIKIAFSVFESTRIPSEWVTILNTKFDAVVVADPFYVKVYKDSGVAIPIFHIPLGIYIDEFLQKPLRTAPNKPFVFGSCSRFFKRKNHAKLIKAFAAEYGNNKNVVLKINGGGKWGNPALFDNLKRLVKKLKVSNVYITNDALSWKDYVEFKSSMDCDVNISCGEGFSITPREALARGIPAIVSDNTAQKTICASQFVRAVSSPIRLAHNSKQYGNLGFQFDCMQSDVQKALRDMYENYSHYLAKAHKGREWVKQYRWDSLQKKYLNLIKPNTIKLGTKNEITDDYIMTDSKTFYEKLCSLNS